ncbi:MAG: hypothetical protein Unbinned6224contig1000_45 [Prokaryotic dsDNA virus sp.]|nr:MAG: hypothetical protein Unbinned6224contig1000_45 [Prokaryotic dsDNA virus sp.]|tara:strand:- start:41151 stop:43016 length:1866 start_codon:yes stop_codon:yes gene_type:complete
MAKIENTKVYPTVTPAMDDLLIATDVSNKNETVTFLVSDLIGGAGVLQGLQSVLDTGNTATQNINLTGVGAGGGITVIGTVYPTTITASGTTGVAGQILSSTGTGIQWINSPSVSCCGWEDTLIIDPESSVNAVMDAATMTFQNAGAGIIITTPGTLSNSGISTFTGQVNVNSTSINFNATGQINDGAGATGTAGQWLTSTGTGLAWSSTIPPASCCDLQSTLNIGSTSFNQGMSFTGTSSITMAAGVSIGSSGNNVFSGTNTFSGTLDVDACLEDSLGSCGTAGQVLISTGSAVQWSNGAGIGAQNLQGVLDTAPFGATGANANVVISGTLNAGTITDNSGSTGAVGQYLAISGAGLTWTTLAPGGVTSVTAGSPAISTGAPLTITPTTGAVVATSNYFGGSNNVGHVPDSTAVDQITNFLRADGSWAVPPGGSASNPEEVVRIPFFNPKWDPGTTGASDYYTFDGITQGPAFGIIGNNNVGATIPSSATITAEDYIGGMVWGYPPAGSCTLLYNSWAVCSVKFQVFSDTNTSFFFQLWKGPLCPTGTGVTGLTLLANCEFAEVDITKIACCDGTVAASPANLIGHGEALFMTLTNAGVGSNAVKFQGNVFINLQKAVKP